MGTYAELMERSDKAERLANDYRQKGDIDMTLFWHNASIGYKLRALNLTM